MDYEVFELGNVTLQAGLTLRSAKLAYKTFGQLNDAKNNVIIFPTHYSGRHTENEAIIGEGKGLDPTKYFIIIPNMFGNGLSSSPDNTPLPFDKARFPQITIYDNVMYQHQLIKEKFGIERIALVMGFSMGAQQAYHWGAMFPDMVERIMPICGSAKTSTHNFVFLEGVKAALTADDAWMDGWYENPPTKGLRAMARVWAGWALSQAFYREGYHLNGHSSLEDFLINSWEGSFLKHDANNLLTMLWTWQNGDISTNEKYNSDFVKALNGISAKAIVMPSETDLYFPMEDNLIETSHMPNAECRSIKSIFGHTAGGPAVGTDDALFIDHSIKELLAS